MQRLLFSIGSKILFVLLILSAFSLSTAAENSGSSDEIMIYAVFPTSGDLSSQAVASEAGLSLAVDDMNALFREIGSDKTVTLSVTEIASDTDSAVAAVESLYDSGARLVLGYFSSAQIKAIKPYVDTHDMLILSSGSTATSLSVADNIFRFNPDDTKQAEVIALLMDNYNILDVVPLVRDDLWGNELVSLVQENMETGITPDNIVTYDPDTGSYEEVVNRLDSKIGLVLDQKSADEVSVLAITLGEIVPIIEKASDAKYANLSCVRWFLVDGNTLLPEITYSQKASTYGSEQMFTGVSLSRNTFLSDCSLRECLIYETGCEPDGFSYATYDMGKIAVQALCLEGSHNAEALKEAVTTISDTYTGVSATAKLNEAGDRIAGYYIFWKLNEDPTGCVVWERVGTASRWTDDYPFRLYMEE